MQKPTLSDVRTALPATTEYRAAEEKCQCWWVFSYA
jgi:hypothetical protein